MSTNNSAQWTIPESQPGEKHFWTTQRIGTKPFGEKFRLRSSQPLPRKRFLEVLSQVVGFQDYLARHQGSF
jgi:hypothetical protein